ncbi:MAG: hypothetical protein IPM79_14830 [Polyangiaceae bacterium]|jgi:uncharacterized protein involved in exopolysaccharide biosynthesis|nr:hypothetical protein [Polyangiaceae bacterium]MBK8938858.1 hypothetical protein [Polyangiaceae bacterium]
MDNTTSLGTGEPQGGAGVELARMLTIVKRAILNWKPSALIIALGLIAGVSYAVVRKPSYKSETIVIYRQGVRLQQEGGGQSLTLGTRLQEILLARSRLDAIVKEMGLYEETRAKRGEIEAVEEFRRDITFRPRSTDTFSISYKGRDPEVVKKVTERLAQSLIDENQRLRIQQSKVQQEFLSVEKSNAETILKEKEFALATFLSENPEFALDQTGQFGASMRVQRQLERESQMMSSIGGAAPDARTLALQRQAARLNAALSGDTPAPMALDVPADPQLESERQLAETAVGAARADLASHSATLTDAHPNVVAAKKRLSDAQAVLKDVEGRIASDKAKKLGGTGVGLDPEAARQKLIDRKKRVEAELTQRDKKDDKDKDKKDKDKPKEGDPKTEGEVDAAEKIVALETDWARKSRDVGEARDQMNELERNYFRAQIEAASSLGGYSDQVVVLDPAYIPTRPEPPGKTLIVLIAGGAAGMFAMILAIIRALLDSRIYEEADLSRVSPVLAVVPRGTSRRWWRR